MYITSIHIVYFANQISCSHISCCCSIFRATGNAFSCFYFHSQCIPTFTGENVFSGQQIALCHSNNSFIHGHVMDSDFKTMIFRKNLSCNMGPSMTGDDIERIFAMLVLLSGADYLNRCSNSRMHNGFFQFFHILIVQNIERVIWKCYQLPGIDHQSFRHGSFITLFLRGDNLGVFFFLYLAVLHDFS